MRDPEVACATATGEPTKRADATVSRRHAQLLLEFALPETRPGAARELARALGADDLILFLRDAEVDAFLPAPGLPQTLPDGRSWQALVTRSAEEGEAEGRLRMEADLAAVQAWAMACGPDSVVVLLGEAARRDEARLLIPQLRVAGMAILGEQVARFARAHERLSREMTAQAETLAASLDRARLQAEAAYDEAASANQAKADFLAVVSHELRTPLNAILGYGDLLDAEIAGPLNEAQKAHLARMTTGARHLLHLIEEILTFSRMEAGEERVDAEEVDGAAVVRDAATLLEPLARTGELDFHVDVPTEPLWMTTDPGKVRQILINLLSNAIKFTRVGGVRVEMAEHDGGVTIAVTDSGVGIPREHHERIFEPFRQVDDVHTRVTGGTGLGLSVSRQLAGLLGGELTLKSAPGEGSTFTLRLPHHMES